MSKRPVPPPPDEASAVAVLLLIVCVAWGFWSMFFAGADQVASDISNLVR